MAEPEQCAIDEQILTFYSEEFDEGARLTTRSAQGSLEFTRVQEIVREYLSGGRVLDVGGATGHHARSLMNSGYEVELIDPVPVHVERAAEAGVSSRLGDARALPFEDNHFDGVLLLGPLYHLASVSDREGALAEAKRVTRSGGFIFAAALSRFIAFGAMSLGAPTPEPLPSTWVDLLASGRPAPGLRFPAGHFHTAEELHAEVESAGLAVIEVVGIEGPAGLYLEELTEARAAEREAALLIARAASAMPGIRDLSPHLLAIAQVGGSSHQPE
ncbi:class I SAM-dependent methyltransferase [Leifsonia soli]|uniref:SAM-dependent methyltransferase n=1 Tax=Leifsonia soli TaxID=582665 RepID=A0A852T4K4_9MICO|nr:class I SAM-dependent methyltransferase [Leifsonia soli]NYD75792.1 SAM-dependent methyltransferase [Leifsonia soli]